MLSAARFQQVPSLPFINSNSNYVGAGSVYSSAIQTQRSRVFARKEERFPAVVQQAARPAGQPSQLRQPSQAIRSIRVEPRNANPEKLFSAPQPAGKSTVRHFPSVARSLPNGTSSPGKRSIKSQSDGKAIISHVAGVSSKEHQLHLLRTEKMASGWAEARVAHAIPNLRDSLEPDKIPAENDKDSSHSTISETKVSQAADQIGGLKRKQIVKQSSNQEVKQNATQKVEEERKERGNAQTTDNKLKHKRTHSQKTKVAIAKSKASSGYSSMSSNSQHGHTTTDNKYSVFKPSTHTESLPSSEKAKALSSVYKSKVKVERTQGRVGHQPTDQEVVLTEREADMYTHLKSTYQRAAEQERERRKANFFKKLQDIQIDSALQHNQEVQSKTVKKEQSKKRQLEQLTQIRNKFEEDRQKRYKSQYVTKNFLNYERMDRGEYGLPENFTSKTQYQAKLRPGGGKVTALDFIKREVRLKRNYSKMFAHSASKKSSASEPKMEGRDRITLEAYDAEGNPVKGKRIDVKTELREAENLLKDIEPEVEDKPAPTSNAKNLQTNQKSLQPKDQKPSAKSRIPARVNVADKSASLVQPKAPLGSTLVIHPQDNSKSVDVRKSVFDTHSISSQISAITEESETGDDFYDKLMAKYGIELSDDDDD